MKTLALKAALALLIAASILTTQASISIGDIKNKARAAGSGLTTSTSNGKTTIVWQHKEVWSGKTTGKVTAKTKVVGDTQYAAVWDGSKVIWENVKGAAEKVK